MNEITKLYENAGVESVGFNPYKLEDEYPPFTAEKQIELIKWLKDNRSFHAVGKWCTACDSTGEVIEHRSELFEEALTGLINQLWKANDLTEEEKQQVKGILNR